MRYLKRNLSDRLVRHLIVFTTLFSALCIMFLHEKLPEVAGKRPTAVVPPQVLERLLDIPRDVIIIEPFHGLGNRLRSFASAAALAKKTSRQLVVVWLRDPHVNTSMSALIDTTNLTVFEYPIRDLLARRWGDIKVYDYNSLGRKDEVLEDNSRTPIYVRSAYILQSGDHFSAGAV